MATSFKSRLKYLMAGAKRRLTRSPACPCCGTPGGKPVDRKFVYLLMRCEKCDVLFRHPAETPAEMAAFYQAEYKQAGLTTDLPDDTELSRLIESNFAKSDKDFSFLPKILQSLGIGPGARVFDYGANWGYSVYQLRKAGYQAEGYEISKPRAAFAKKLGVDIYTDLAAISGRFDAVYSGHVLEHVPDPRASIREQLRLLGGPGYVIGHTPNGSEARHRQSPIGFRTAWGQVHPVLLNDEFVVRNFGELPAFISSETASPSALAEWDRESLKRTQVDGGELFFVLRQR